MVFPPCPSAEGEERRRRIRNSPSMRRAWPAKRESKCTFSHWAKRRYPIRAQPWVSPKQAAVPIPPYREPQMCWPWLKISHWWEWTTFRWLTKPLDRRRHSFVWRRTVSSLPRSRDRRDATKSIFAPAPVMVLPSVIRCRSFISRGTNGLWIWRSFSKERKISSWKSSAWGEVPRKSRKRPRKAGKIAWGDVNDSRLQQRDPQGNLCPNDSLIDGTLATPSIRFGSDGDFRSPRSFDDRHHFYGFSQKDIPVTPQNHGFVRACSQ